MKAARSLIPPELARKILDQLVFDQVVELDSASQLPALEDELTRLIEAQRVDRDPPARIVAVELLLGALDRGDAAVPRRVS